ncbi:MAG: hypothetical protein AAGI03_03000 [Pseudomonadota bacterium]
MNKRDGLAAPPVSRLCRQAGKATPFDEQSDGFQPASKLSAMTPRDAESLAWSLGFAARRLAGARDLAAPKGWIGSHVLRGIWQAACRELHYLEVMVRRLLVAMAGEMTELVQPQPADTSIRRPKAEPITPCVNGPSGKGASPPMFSVHDTKLGPKALQARLSAMGHWEGEVPTRLPEGVFGARPASSSVVEASALADRFVALAAVLADPEPYAKRMALKLGRGVSPLRLGVRPALARSGALDLATSAFFEAERLALTVLNRRAPLYAQAQHLPETPPEGRSYSGDEGRGPGAYHESEAAWVRARPPPRGA